MLTVAKTLVVDQAGKFLLLYRADHPRFGTDPDLPGGIVEAGESPAEGAAREMEEEIGITVAAASLRPLYSGTGSSLHGTVRHLYIAVIDTGFTPKLSWEHSGFEWLDRETMLSRLESAKDPFMHTVLEQLIALNDVV